jgi:hypothetical protein
MPTEPHRCYYGDESCEGDLWQCRTCKEWFCQGHFHSTSQGDNVECVACERERKEAALDPLPSDSTASTA